MKKQMNIPKLRFSEFDDKWVDVKVGELFPKIRNGFVGTATPYYSTKNEGVKYLQGKNVKNNTINEKGMIFINQDFHVKHEKSQLKEHDVVMVQSGHVGECARITKELDNTNCHALLVASPNRTLVNSDFSVYYFYSPVGKNLTHKITTGNTIRHILGSDLKDLNIFTPPLSEQQKIASFLSTVDKKIELLTEKKAKLTEYKKGVMQQLFNGRFEISEQSTQDGKITFIPPTLRFKADDGSDFSDWEEKKLGSLGSFAGGGTPDTKNPECWVGDVPWISSSDVIDDNIFKIEKSRFITRAAIEGSATKIIPKDSILIVSRVGVGKFVVSTEDICTSQDFSNFTPKELDVIFMAYNLYFNKHKLESLAQGTSIKGFTTGDLKSMKLGIPSRREQGKIANFLSAIDQKIELANSEVEKAKEWKKGLLQQMFV